MSRDRGRHHERLHGSQRIVDLAPTSTPGRLRGLVVNVRSGYAWIKAGAVEYFGGDENLSLVPQPDGSQRIPPPLRVGMAVEFTPAADPRGKQPLARLIVIIETRGGPWGPSCVRESTMVCEMCGGPLVVDVKSVTDLAAMGGRGGRVFCRLGCFDTWLLRGRRPAPVTTMKVDGRGKYDRRTRTFICEMCQQQHTTRGPKTRWCLECRAALKAERCRARQAARRA